MSSLITSVGAKNIPSLLESNPALSNELISTLSVGLSCAGAPSCVFS
jgi:hypothetical protein